MRLDWSDQALDDLERLYEFLVEVAPQAAARRFDRLLTAPDKLLDFPRLGAPITKIENRDVRRLIVDGCEIQYEIGDDAIRVLAIFHTRENR